MFEREGTRYEITVVSSYFVSTSVRFQRPEDQIPPESRVVLRRA